MLAEVDQLDGDRDAGEEAVDQGGVVPDEGEDRPVVIRVRVDVEQLRTGRERTANRRDDVRAPALGDVGHGLEHDPYPTKPCPAASLEAPHETGGARSCASSASCARTVVR